MSKQSKQSKRNEAAVHDLYNLIDVLQTRLSEQESLSAQLEESVKTVLYRVNAVESKLTQLQESFTEEVAEEQLGYCLGGKTTTNAQNIVITATEELLPGFLSHMGRQFPGKSDGYHFGLKEGAPDAAAQFYVEEVEDMWCAWKASRGIS